MTAAILALLALGGATAGPPTFSNDLAGAMEAARRVGRPLVIELWAPW